MQGDLAVRKPDLRRPHRLVSPRTAVSARRNARPTAAFRRPCFESRRSAYGQKRPLPPDIELSEAGLLKIRDQTSTGHWPNLTDGARA
jgi:hypothetical protein